MDEHPWNKTSELERQLLPISENVRSTEYCEQPANAAQLTVLPYPANRLWAMPVYVDGAMKLGR